MSQSQNGGMEKPYPSREKDRWEHALSRPLQGITFEMLELMRTDLFEYLDVLTTCPYNDKESNESRAHDLERVARRLAELTPRRAKALRAALKAGRVQYAWLSDPDVRRANPGPLPGIGWQEAQEYWKSVQA